MDRKTENGFTLVELLVVIAIIALLMSILMPALAKVKNQAKTAACAAHLHQMGTAALMYTHDNDSYFHKGYVQGGSTRFDHWMVAWEPYYLDGDIRCCPAAPKSKTEIDEQGNVTTHKNPFVAWGIFPSSNTWFKEGHYGSYAINGWVSNPPLGISWMGVATDAENHWRRSDVKGAGIIPLMLDSPWVNAWPYETDIQPEYSDQTYLGMEGIGRFCVNRHDGFVNCVFLDSAVRKIGLKQLWLLKWHQFYDTTYAVTYPVDWSYGTGWMAKFKKYDDAY